MNHSKIEKRTSILDQAIHLPGTVLSMVHPLGLWQTIKAKQFYEKLFDQFEKFMVILTVGGFVAGIFTARYSERFADWINSLVEGFIDGYGLIAPVTIFLILSPSLARMFETRSMSRFGRRVVWWFAIRKVLACLWAVIFTVIVFGFPLLPQKATSVGAAIIQTISSLGTMMATSPYFWAMYAAVIVAFLSSKSHSLSWGLEKTLQGIEIAARYFMPFIPLFMFAIGTYIYGLPANLEKQIGLQREMETFLQPFSIWGLPFNPQTSWGMIWIYLFGSLLVGLACFLWHLSLLLVTRLKVKQFSLRSYFVDYWIKVYPLLWSTSSEAIATPLNLYLVKRYAPWVQRNVRRFVVGIGSYMNINGTLICVLVLGGVVFRMLGVEVSLVEWLMLIPVVFLISYGVPGIPGELVLFAGPIATLLALPETIEPAFLTIYIGLQMGLPDSFRTGNNSTDDHLCAILLNEIYEKRFSGEAEEEDAE